MGYAASGLLHVLIGVIALQIASGGSGDADSSGAVATLAGQPGGLVLLWICFLGCLALALFQVSRIWLGGGALKDKDLWKMRGSAASQAAAYGAIGVTFGSFALGGGTDSGESSASWSARLMAQPAGALLLGLVGLGTLPSAATSCSRVSAAGSAGIWAPCRPERGTARSRSPVFSALLPRAFRWPSSASW
ncbi:DUF1206 domain-containing protein [Arthrobacter sp. ATA002]|uniref:DUF1206 domain-containing protein n=1 Tax=Arthrobacter sp. ATA002 TaxID=2991715 RepID=UPI0022A73E88|nr:DUF1206 domain-containing protein [Arthrobacter sp. ATA002]WAP51833.1 DUF1206 domain-containing protein [Arthrobacter sp. ATA002]